MNTTSKQSEMAKKQIKKAEVIAWAFFFILGAGYFIATICINL